MSSFQTSLELARRTMGLNMNLAYATALNVKDKVSAKEYQAISEHLINVQAGKIEALVRNYKEALGEKAWSPQMIEGLNQALRKAGVEIAEVNGGETKEARHSDFFQKRYIRKFEKSEEHQQLTTLLSTLREEQEELDAEYSDIFGGSTDDSAIGKVVANKLQIEVAKIVVYIEDLLCADQEMPMQEEALRALDFALQVNGHELRGINLAADLPPSDLLLFEILETEKTTEAALGYNAREDEEVRATLTELTELIQKCAIGEEPATFSHDLLGTLEFQDYISSSSYKTYLQSLTGLRDNLTIEEVLARLEQDIDLFNAELIVKVIESEQANLNESALRLFAGNVQFNMNHVKPILDEESGELGSFELSTVTDDVVAISLNTPYQDLLAYAWSEVDLLITEFTIKNDLFDLENFRDLGLKGSIYPLTYQFLSEIIASFGAAKAITTTQIRRAAKAHYKKVLEEAKKQDLLHREKVLELKEEARRAQTEGHREHRETVRREASEEAARVQDQRAWYNPRRYMPEFSFFS